MRKGFLRNIVMALALGAPALPVMALDVPPPAEEARYTGAFRVWLRKEIWPRALEAGVSEQTLQATFANLKIIWKLPDLVLPDRPPPPQASQSQAEFSSPGAYFDEKRLQGLAATGRSLMSTHAAVLKRIEATYGVPAPVIVAIWGRESGFGRAKLPYSALDVLATKAWMSTRGDMFRAEFLAALHIVDGGDIAADRLMGSWAGALGQPQFMPSSFLEHAVDFDGDGHRDIWNSVPDSLASIASYLSKKGWQRGRGWGYEVSIPGDVSCAQEGPDKAKPVSAWLAQGIKPVSGSIAAADAKAEGMMLVPAGRHGPEFIVTPNFYVLKEYNNSDLYALFIGNLADRIAKGAGAFQGKWGPVGGMLRSDVLAMQKVLASKGYDVGRIDGLAGFKTRRSLGDWQAKTGLAATCFPDASLKAKLK